MRANLTLTLAWRLAACLAGDVITHIRGDRILHRERSGMTELCLRDCCDYLRGLPKAERKPMLYAMKFIVRGELKQAGDPEARQILRRDLRAAITHARTLANPEAA